jgi:hypothetical protein
MPCIAISFLSHLWFCLHMLQLTMHSLVMRAAANREPLIQVRVMPSRRVTTL